MRQLRPNASAPVPSNFRVVQGQICPTQRVHKDDGAIVILSDLTRDIGNIELEKDGNEHQDWAREGCSLMLDCACVLYLCTILPCLGPNHCVLRPSHLDRACPCFSRSLLRSSLFSLKCRFFFLYHPAIRPSSLLRTGLRTLFQAIDSAPNSLDAWRHHSGTELFPSTAHSS